MKKKLMATGLALILTLGVGGFTAFASEVGNASRGGYFGTQQHGVDLLCRGGGGGRGGGGVGWDPTAPPRP
ncbi:MAG: hypothetical protein FWG65_05210 [Turicibacter sp.]|nr:hypothetical protein [Turicibacter sp.]